jgi:hypothetical protein
VPTPAACISGGGFCWGFLVTQPANVAQSNTQFSLNPQPQSQSGTDPCPNRSQPPTPTRTNPQPTQTTPPYTKPPPERRQDGGLFVRGQAVPPRQAAGQGAHLPGARDAKGMGCGGAFGGAGRTLGECEPPKGVGRPFWSAWPGRAQPGMAAKEATSKEHPNHQIRTPNPKPNLKTYPPKQTPNQTNPPNKPSNKPPSKQASEQANQPPRQTHPQVWADVYTLPVPGCDGKTAAEIFEEAGCTTPAAPSCAACLGGPRDTFARMNEPEVGFGLGFKGLEGWCWC